MPTDPRGSPRRGPQPFFDHEQELPCCGECRFLEWHPGPDDRCAIDGQRVRSGTAACERYVMVRQRR